MTIITKIRSLAGLVEKPGEPPTRMRLAIAAVPRPLVSGLPKSGTFYKVGREIVRFAVRSGKWISITTTRPALLVGFFVETVTLDLEDLAIPQTNYV